MEYFPVLAYHKISPEKELGLTTVAPQTFDRHINIILESGFTPVTFAQLASKTNIPKRPMIITFDDGYESIFNYALPILEKYHIKSVVYVLAGYIGKINTWEAFPVQRKFRHLTESQIRELSDMDIEIGSHGLTHKYFPTLKISELQSELETSRKIIEDITGKKVHSFCYPYGISGNLMRKEIFNHGYKYAVGNIQMHNTDHINPTHIGRRSIYSCDSDQIFRQKLCKPQCWHQSVLSEKLIRLGAITGIFYKILMNY